MPKPADLSLVSGAPRSAPARPRFRRAVDRRQVSASPTPEPGRVELAAVSAPAAPSKVFGVLSSGMADEEPTATVAIATASGDVVVGRATCDRIVEELRHLPNAAATIQAFEAVGTSAPVELDENGKSILLSVIRSLAAETEADDDMPTGGLEELRDALLAELGEIDDSTRPWSE